ncbi:MAG: DUF2262 domain-containing protein [Tannerellaceae bacterium]|nr:DUF2262 domain-containing protein [Tannerellaceae bacterium]
MNIQDFLKQFTFSKSVYDDGSGFWDSYEGETRWLGKSVFIHIAARSVSEEMVALYQKIMAQQDTFDTMWKNFAVNEMYDQIKTECKKDTITKQQFIQELEVETLSFGFDRDSLLSIWFARPESFPEHTLLLYAHNDGTPGVTVMEG